MDDVEVGMVDGLGWVMGGGWWVMDDVEVGMVDGQNTLSKSTIHFVGCGCNSEYRLVDF